jgi:Got1/Sft2-like family protein
MRHLISKERLPFSVAYLFSLGLTLYFALGVRNSSIVRFDRTDSVAQPHSYFGSLIGAVVQVIALLSYVLAYFPGGIQTLRFGGQMALRGVGTLLPL